MVRGNWQRRIEMADKRRDEARKVKALRADPLRSVNGEAVSRKLLKMHSEQGIYTGIVMSGVYKDPELNGYLKDDTKNVCSNWLRFGDCVEDGSTSKKSAKKTKCKYRHEAETPLFRIRGLQICLPSSESGTDVKEEPFIYPAKALHSISPEEFSTLSFITCNAVVIYDYARPDVWLSWLARNTALATSVSAVEIGAKLRPISEADACSDMSSVFACAGVGGGVDGDGDRDDALESSDDGSGDDEEGFWEGEDGDGEGEGLGYVEKGATMLSIDQPMRDLSVGLVVVAEKEGSISYVPFGGGEYLENLPTRVTSLLLWYLNDRDICALMETSKTLKRNVQKDDYTRIRRKEAIAAVQGKLNKDKKKQKKKESKKAFLGADTVVGKKKYCAFRG
jgi:hypothetical protein